MTNFVDTLNDQSGGRFRKLFKKRDIFVHDGNTLRRWSVSAGVQIAAAIGILVAPICSAVAAVQLVDAPSAPVAQAAPAAPANVAEMQRQVEVMQAEVALIKEVAQKRYQITANEVKKLGINPERLASAQTFTGTGGPFEAVQPLKAATDPQFKQLFMSWKKLDQIEQGTIAIPSVEPSRAAPSLPASASAPIRSAAAPRCTPVSIWPARSAPRSTRPPTAWSSAPNIIMAATATSSS
jgi:hypothetical protein